MPVNPFRKADLHNLPRLKARQRFLDQLAEHRPVIMEELFGFPQSTWISLSDAARDLCRLEGWKRIDASPTWKNLEPSVASNNPAAGEEQRIHLEIIPLRDYLCAWASKFQLLHKAAPATWIMDTALETLDKADYGRKGKRLHRWSHPTELSQEYPAVTEPGWTNTVTGLPEEELFDIWIKIPPKQPNESFKDFEKRFNNACREARERYVRRLKADAWSSQPPYRDFLWIDRLAQWQAGRSASEIDPSIKNASDWAAFSRGIRRSAEYIEISPRTSKYNPKRRLGH